MQFQNIKDIKNVIKIRNQNGIGHLSTNSLYLDNRGMLSKWKSL